MSEIDSPIGFANELCNFIRSKTANPLGLFRTEKFNVETLEWSSNICDPDDLGDFAPFMVWIDLIQNSNKNTSWVLKQASLLKEYALQNSGFYVPLSSENVKKSKMTRSYPQNHIDLLVGLDILYRMTKEKKLLDMKKGICNAFMNYAISKRGFVYGSVLPLIRTYWPRHGYMRIKPTVSGVVLEEMANLYEITKEERFLEVSKKIARAWTGTNAFKKAGLFPSQVYPYIHKESKYINISKEVTNMCFGLLRLYELSEDQEIRRMVEKAIQGLLRFKTKDDTFTTGINIKTLKITDDKENLTYNHMAFGVLLDAYEILKNKEYLDITVNGMKKWVSLQSRNGLFPKHIPGREKWKEVDLDSHADTLVILSRLLNHNQDFKEPLKKGLNSMMLFRSKSKCAYSVINFDNGKPINTTNELKFLGGALKGILASWTALEKDNTLSKEVLRQLIRDR